MIIAGGAVALVVLGLFLMQSLSYTPQKMNVSLKNTSAITWRDVYRLSDVSEYRYEITYIKGGKIEWVDALYTVSLAQGAYAISITTYDGILPSNQTAGISVSSLTYSCVSRHYNGEAQECSGVFSSRPAQLASYALPNMLRASEKLDAKKAVSGIYRENAVQALILEKMFYKGEKYTIAELDNETNTTVEREAERLIPTGKLVIWAVDGMPVPLRIERTYEDGGIAIANLKYYK